MKNKMPWANFFSASIFFTFLVLCTEKKVARPIHLFLCWFADLALRARKEAKKKGKKKRNRRRRRRRRRGRGTGRWLAPGTCGAAFAAVAGAWAAARSVGSAGSDAPVALFVGAGVSLLLFLFFFWSCFVIRSRREVFWGSYTPPRRMERRMDRRYRERSRVQHPIDLESRSPMAWQHRDFNYQQHSTFHDRYPGRHIGDNNRSRRVHVQILDKILFY